MDFHFSDEVILGTVMGAVIGVFGPLLFLLLVLTFNVGLLFSHLMKFSHRRGFIDRESYVAQYLALSLFITGVASRIGTDDLLAAFAAGNYEAE